MDIEVFGDMDKAVVLRNLPEVGTFIIKVPDLVGNGRQLSFTPRPTSDLLKKTVDKYAGDVPSIECVETLHAFKDARLLLTNLKEYSLLECSSESFTDEVNADSRDINGLHCRFVHMIKKTLVNYEEFNASQISKQNLTN